MQAGGTSDTVLRWPVGGVPAAPPSGIVIWPSSLAIGHRPLRLLPGLPVCVWELCMGECVHVRVRAYSNA